MRGRYTVLAIEKACVVWGTTASQRYETMAKAHIIMADQTWDTILILRTKVVHRTCFCAHLVKGFAIFVEVIKFDRTANHVVGAIIGLLFAV